MRLSDYIKEQNLIDDAEEFATVKHHTQTRNDGTPYITHPKAVAEIVKEFGGDTEMVTAAWLHDTLEDTDATIEEIIMMSGKRVASLVQELTVPKDIDANPDKTVKDTYLINHLNQMSPDAFTIKLADRLHNVSHNPSNRYKLRTKQIISQLNRTITGQQQKLIQAIVSKIEG